MVLMNNAANNTSLFLSRIGNVMTMGMTSHGRRATRSELIDYLVEHGLATGPHFHEYTSTYHDAVYGDLVRHGKMAV